MATIRLRSRLREEVARELDRGVEVGILSVKPSRSAA
jgi:hypothetical protein